MPVVARGAVPRIWVAPFWKIRFPVGSGLAGSTTRAAEKMVGWPYSVMLGVDTPKFVMLTGICALAWPACVHTPHVTLQNCNVHRVTHAIQHVVFHCCNASVDVPLILLWPWQEAYCVHAHCFGISYNVTQSTPRLLHDLSAS